MKAILFLIIPFLPLIPQTKNETGTISFKIAKRKYTYRKKAIGVIKKGKFRYSKLIIGFEDLSVRTHLFISVELLTARLQKPLELSTDYDKLYFIYRSPQGNYLVKPTVDYLPGRAKHSYKWRQLDKSEKLATGIGVVDNRKLEGTILYLNLKPIFQNEEIRFLKGNFHGKIKFSNGIRSDLINIEEGSFYVAVEP
ncbi:MAG: hypothetical protein AAF518_05525 [Spirochaetota bacterium]